MCLQLNVYRLMLSINIHALLLFWQMCNVYRRRGAPPRRSYLWPLYVGAAAIVVARRWHRAAASYIC